MVCRLGLIFLGFRPLMYILSWATLFPKTVVFPQISQRKNAFPPSFSGKTAERLLLPVQYIQPEYPFTSLSSLQNRESAYFKNEFSTEPCLRWQNFLHSAILNFEKGKTAEEEKGGKV